MYEKNKMPRTSLVVNKSYEAETIEMMIRRQTKQGEPIDEGAPMIFPPDPGKTSPQHNIKVDKFEQAMASLSAVEKARIAKGEGVNKGEGTEPGPGGPEGE